MKAASETGEQVVLFDGRGVEHIEVFGKMKRIEDPPIKSLLTWNNVSQEPKEPRTKIANYEWVSEAHDAFKSYMAASAHSLRPNSAFQAKPIVENEVKPPEQVTGKEPKKSSQSPNPRQRSLSHSPKAQKHSTPKNTQKGTKRQQERIKKLNQTTRWMANSSFKTYFGKPVFANYGQGNVNPTYGGLMYGDYMKTHNIAPHEGSNNPSTQQVYEIAETKALQRISKAPVVPRKCKDEDRLAPEEVLKLKQRSQILPKNKDKPSKNIVKPDLLKEKVFKSEHNSENEELQEDEQEFKPINKAKSKKDLGINNKIPAKGNLQGTLSAKRITEPVVMVKGQKKVQEEQKIKVPEREKPEVHEEKSAEENENEDENEKIEERKDFDRQSHDVSVQAEDCQDCLNQNVGKLVRTCYQDMTSKVIVDKNNKIVEPFKYCARCRDALYNEDVLRPPFSLGEIPFQELDPKNYKTLPPQWTQRIPAAGKLSYRSPSAYNVIFGDNQPLGGYS